MSGTWSNDTLQLIVVPLTTSASIDQVNVNLISHNSGLETDDNWDIDGVNVLTWQPDSPATCQVSLQGDYLARLTGSNGTLTMVPRTGCP